MSTDATELYQKITALLREQKHLAEVVVGHISCKHEIYNLAAFHVTTAVTATEKIETYKEIVRGLACILQGKPHTLLGKSASGQAAPVAPPPAAPLTEEQKAEKLRTDRSFILPETEPETDGHPAAVIVPAVRKPAAAPAPAAPASDDPLTAQFRAIIKQILGPIDVSPEAIAELVDKRLAEQLEAYRKTADTEAGDARKQLIEALRKEFSGDLSKAAESVRATLEEFIKKQIAQLPAGGGTRQMHIHVRGQVGKVEGITHRQFMQLATWVAADVPLWVWGPAGGGKTTIGEQIAQALGLPFYCISIDETITVGKLVGFKNLSNGEYVEGLLYRPYKEGGVVMLDEIDTNSSTIASLNAMLANDHYTFGNGERVARHENFRVIAGANTKGTGAVAGYTARVRLDAATLDRFAVIELKYDWDMIEELLGGRTRRTSSWQPGDPATTAGAAEWSRWVREVSENFGASVLISPRAALLGARALRAGVPVAEVADALVFKLMAPDTITRIRAAKPLPQIATEPMKEAA